MSSNPPLTSHHRGRTRLLSWLQRPRTTDPYQILTTDPYNNPCSWFHPALLVPGIPPPQQGPMPEPSGSIPWVVCHGVGCGLEKVFLSMLAASSQPQVSRLVPCHCNAGMFTPRLSHQGSEYATSDDFRHIRHTLDLRSIQDWKANVCYHITIIYSVPVGDPNPCLRARTNEEKETFRHY